MRTEEEDFIRYTVNMPGLRDVFAKKKDEDYIIIQTDFVQMNGIRYFNFCIQRLAQIMELIKVSVYLENCGAQGYKLHAKRMDK